uniref:Uncharacterized protein n=1 Tax=Phaeomonas parva TaxID=124430 RepID=A0A6U4KKI1_9STRA|mmetsp:Transcript_45302/g.142015  ORF Transcript_45302/g.142015 Transcript_45302/m.142015 type:complete len:190 (+) Transcript_45302:269-838(+)
MDFLNLAQAVGGDNNLWTAASDGDLTRVQGFLSGGAGLTVDSQDENGYAPLHAAASYGHVELAQWLLAQGAAAGLADGDGDTPLHYCESAAVAELLLAAGAPAAAPNGEGVTPAAQAIEDDREEMIAFWLARGLLTPAQVEEWRQGGMDADGAAGGDGAGGGEGFRIELGTADVDAGGDDGADPARVEP